MPVAAVGVPHHAQSTVNRAAGTGCFWVPRAGLVQIAMTFPIVLSSDLTHLFLFGDGRRVVKAMGAGLVPDRLLQRFGQGVQIVFPAAQQRPQVGALPVAQAGFEQARCWSAAPGYSARRIYG